MSAPVYPPVPPSITAIEHDLEAQNEGDSHLSKSI